MLPKCERCYAYLNAFNILNPRCLFLLQVANLADVNSVQVWLVGLAMIAGKSRIHGWGAISKTEHKKGDMVIEYSGESIRPSLADVRERGMYDQIVGAGTYIFKLNEDTCIDATRAGADWFKLIFYSAFFTGSSKLHKPHI